jgi:CheY-like chemotaxis protein/HPt (histidine-containing phosphotransfer) domain-containing protein
MRPSAAPEGFAALEALRRAFDENDPFRVALLDLYMPGMDAEALGAAIKADPRVADTRIALMVPLGERCDIGRFVEIGFATYLTKPIRYQDLKGILSPGTLDRGAVPPRQTPFMTSTGGGDELGPSAWSKARILLVEDNITNQQVALHILHKMGLRTDIVADGAEAVKVLEKIPYDLVLMDVQMPVMDGMEATRQIRNPQSAVLNRSVPIIAMTAHAMQGDREKCLQAGMTDYMSKPVSPQVLTGLLQKLLPERKFQREAQKTQEAKTYSTPIWDKAGLLERLMGDEDLAKEIISDFLDDIPTQIQALRECLEQGDVLNAQRRVHTIKGVSANVGGEALREAALELEKAAATGDLTADRALMAELEAQWEQLKEAMIKEITKETKCCK